MGESSSDAANLKATKNHTMKEFLLMLTEFFTEEFTAFPVITYVGTLESHWTFQIRRTSDFV